MPSEASASTPTEKPHHYTYLKEFRTQQCPLFLQHKCGQHRPYSCFHWHFMNQRRRRPVRRRDGTYNYSPDHYCSKYDETTGVCPDGDECPLLHRTAGDTERRYHLRYYKTCTCVYETDLRGHCVKNGAHCAFAHGAQDLRPPLYDVRELHALETAEKQGASVSESPLGSSLEKDRIINEDPRWNDTNYVLANYKTEPCKRPPRLCRQGYACPSYHNTRDRRRSPKKSKYRSTPCPNVKHGDDWGDPTQCENGDGCTYCHTRTEQQFHPEIYKSTKCNDMVQTGYCPRGPFCAFAHVEHEMTSQRDVGSPSETSLAAFVTSLLPGNKSGGEEAAPQADKHAHLDTFSSERNNNGRIPDKESLNNGSLIAITGPENGNGVGDPLSGQYAGSGYPEPIGKGRTSSLSSSVASEGSLSSYQKAPGSEREDSQIKLRVQLQMIENDPSLDASEKSKRKQNLLLLHNLNVGSPASAPPSVLAAVMTGPGGMAGSPGASMSPHARAFYPPEGTVESVVENALDDDLNLNELNLANLERDILRDNDNDTNSVCSSLSTGFSANSSYVGATSVPVTIPSSGGYQRNSMGSLSHSASSSPVGSLSFGFLPHPTQQATEQQQQERRIHDAAAAFLSQPNPGKFSAPGFGELSSVSPHNNGSVSQSPLLGGSLGTVPGQSDVQRLREELYNNKAKLQQWEEGISQARNACEAWKKEAEEAKRKARQADDERQQAIRQRDEAVSQMAKLRQELDQIRTATLLGAAVTGNPLLGMPPLSCDPETLGANHMKPNQKRLRMDLEKLEILKKKQQSVGGKCGLCGVKGQPVGVLPCSHYVLCEGCVSKCTQCPMCRCPVSLVLPK